MQAARNEQATGNLAKLVFLFAVFMFSTRMVSAAAETTGRFEGVASCAGSTCHGRNEGDGKIVCQDELRTWQEPSSKSGAHSRAFNVLASRRGQRIASALDLGKATSAFGRLGSRPFNRREMGKLFLKKRVLNRPRVPYKVSDTVDMSAWVPLRKLQ